MESIENSVFVFQLFCKGNIFPIYDLRKLWASQVAQWAKNPPAMQETQETWIQSPSRGGSSGGGLSNPLHYSRLENLTDRGAWRATVHGVAKGSDTTEHPRSQIHPASMDSIRWVLRKALQLAAHWQMWTISRSRPAFFILRSVLSDSWRPHGL